MNLPTKQECYDLLKKENTPEHIIKHSEIVTKLAVKIAKALKKAGIDINVDLVERAALLHDLKKWEEIQTKGKATHGILAYKALIEKYPEIAKIVKNHLLYTILEGMDTWEEKIVNYADKRVTHENIVSLKERFEYLEKRYPPEDKELREKVKKLYFKLEKDIFDIIGVV